MYISDSDSEGEEKVIDKSVYNCPYYNKHVSNADVIEYAAMESSSKWYDKLYLKSEFNPAVPNSVSNCYSMSLRIQWKLYIPVTIKLLSYSKPTLPTYTLGNVSFFRIKVVGYVTSVSDLNCLVIFNDHTSIANWILLKNQNLQVNDYYTIYGRLNEKGLIVIETIKPWSSDEIIAHFFEVFSIFEPKEMEIPEITIDDDSSSDGEELNDLIIS